MEMELRVTKARLESNSEGLLKVSGYVNRTEQPSEILGGTKRFIEKIAKGAFAQAIKSSQKDIDFLAEHDSKKILASTRNGSLQLKEDESGLFMQAIITPTSWGRDYYELINSGMLRNMSFGFRTIKDSWKRIEANLHERTIEELELFEVSVVKDPAYSQSTIAARGIDLIEEVIVPSNVKTGYAIDKKEERENNMETVHRYGETYKNEAEEKRTKEIKAFNVFIKREARDLQGISGNEDLGVQGVGNGTIPETVADILVEKLEESSPVFARAKKFPTTSRELKIARESSTSAGAFVGEGKSLTEGIISLGHVKLTQKRVGASISLTRQLINDAAMNMAEYVPNLLAKRTFKAIERSILRGTDSEEFKGIVPNEEVNKFSLSLEINDSELLDKMLDMVTSIHPDYLQGSSFIVSRPFFNKLARLKDGAGHFYVQNGIVNGRPTYTFLGLEVVVTNSLDAGDTIGQVPCLFGNLEAGYAVMVKKDPQLIMIQDTEQALRGTVGFVLDTYMDGTVYNPDALTKLTITA
ncbi:phage major capsid protein [Bacillus badius]|uniref:phage major capsid protein n=1 Tax=Bacillus badius TaxID=1455 RepID=UPI002E1A790D|nr:phage major capsid protein [Bacillus badius]MED0667743.1 phage major capsid protein [Bacillus badius]